METMELTDQQSLRIGELPEDYQMIAVDGNAPFVRKPTGQIMRIQQNGRLTSATVAAKRRLADRRADRAGRLAAGREPPTPTQTQIDPQASEPVRTQPESVDLIVRLRRLEGTTQAVLATLRRSLIERVLPTRDGLAHEAAIAFDLNDDQRALDLIDDVAQTVGISGFQ
jgi:hypothetical protein